MSFVSGAALSALKGLKRKRAKQSNPPPLQHDGEDTSSLAIDNENTDSTTSSSSSSSSGVVKSKQGKKKSTKGSSNGPAVEDPLLNGLEWEKVPIHPNMYLRAVGSQHNSRSETLNE